MEIIQTEILPELFDIEVERYSIADINDLEILISTIFLSENFLSKISRNTDTYTLIFKGTKTRDLGLELQELLGDKFLYEFLSDSLNCILIFSPETEFLYDPISGSSKIDPIGAIHQYFFKININI